MKRPLGFFLCCACAAGLTAAIRSTFIPYEDAKPILEALAEILPADLRDIPAENRENAWNTWVQKRDREIRERLGQGDADSVVNFLLFGTSFTRALNLRKRRWKRLGSFFHGQSQRARRRVT